MVQLLKDIQDLTKAIEKINPNKNDGKYAGGYTDACDTIIKSLKAIISINQ